MHNAICFRHGRGWLVSVFTAVLLLLLCSGVSASGQDGMRVGLYYGSNTLTTANLANEVGSGYRFGTYDASGVFTAVGETDIEKITICRDSNLYVSGGTYYETPTVSDYTLLGAYHLQMPESYNSFAAAAAAAEKYPYGFPAYINGSYVVRFEYYSTSANAAADAQSYGATVVGGSSSGYTIVKTGTNTILFEYDCGSGQYLGVQPRGTDTQTWFKGYQYKGGFQYCRRSGGDMTIINFVGLDDYTAGVLPYEMSASWPLETLKAGALAARTYGLYTSKHGTLGFDVCTSTDCQVYRGVYTGTGAENVWKAVRETAGECIYYDGKLIEAVYHSADGGATESSLNTWGTANGYLVGKLDPYEVQVTHPSTSWSYTITGEQMASMLRGMGYSCQTIVKVEILEYTATGNVNRILLTDAAGETFTFTKDNVRVFQNIPSVTYFSRHFTVTAPGQTTQTPDAAATGGYYVYENGSAVQKDEIYAITSDGVAKVSAGNTSYLTQNGIVSSTKPSGEITTSSTSGWTFTGSGYGHNVGMSQYWAYAMGKLGYSYDEILKFYYTGITIR